MRVGSAGWISPGANSRPPNRLERVAVDFPPRFPLSATPPKQPLPPALGHPHGHCGPAPLAHRPSLQTQEQPRHMEKRNHHSSARPGVSEWSPLDSLAQLRGTEGGLRGYQTGQSPRFSLNAMSHAPVDRICMSAFSPWTSRAPGTDTGCLRPQQDKALKSLLFLTHLTLFLRGGATDIGARQFFIKQDSLAWDRRLSFLGLKTLLIWSSLPLPRHRLMETTTAITCNSQPCLRTAIRIKSVPAPLLPPVLRALPSALPPPALTTLKLTQWGEHLEGGDRRKEECSPTHPNSCLPQTSPA